MPTCSRCQRDKPLPEFYSRRGGGHSSYCRLCQQEYGKEHYHKNSAAYTTRRVAHMRRERDEARALIAEAKKAPCFDCKEVHPSWAMDFDHRDPTTKLFNISDGVLTHNRQQLKAEIDKCDVVCALCHRYRTYGKGLRRTPRSTGV